MLRALVDTNQFVSSVLSVRGPQRRLIDAWRARAFLLVLGPSQIEEIDDVLRRPRLTRRYPIDPADREALAHLLRTDALTLPSAPREGVCRDADDDALLACAAAAAVPYLVTGDEDLLSVGAHRGVRIVTAREFLQILEHRD